MFDIAYRFKAYIEFEMWRLNYFWRHGILKNPKPVVFKIDAM